jgi:predicted Zn-dependent protease
MVRVINNICFVGRINTKRRPAMKSKLGLVSLCIVCIFPVLAAQTEPDLFWESYLAGKYKEAANLGAQLGAATPEYYVLAGICYSLAGDDYKAYRMQRRYYFEAEPAAIFIGEEYMPVTDMGFLLEGIEKENKDNFRIYVLEGIVGGMYPNFYLKETPKFYFDKSAALSPNPYAYNYLAFIANLAQDSKTTIEYAQKAIGLKPDYGAAYVNLAGSYFRQGERERATDALLECLVKCPSPPDQAFQSLFNIVSEEVTLPTPGKQKDQTYTTMGIADTALRSRIIQALKPNPKNYLEFAELYVNEGNIREPTAFLEGFDVPEDLANLYTYLAARICYMKDDYRGFDKLSQKITGRGWDDYRRLYEIGNLYYLDGKTDRALDCFSLGLDRLDSMDLFYKAKYSSEMALCFLAKKDTSRARSFLDDAVKSYPDDAATFVNLGIAYFELNDEEQSRQMFAKTFNYKPTPEQRDIIESYLDEKLK